MGKSKSAKSAAAAVVVAVPEVKVAECEAVLQVGASLPVTSDYKDMEAEPEVDGLPHRGYLVLRKGEVVKVLYAGSQQAGDPGWIFGEVLRALAPEPVGRRGWLPATALQPASSGGGGSPGPPKDSPPPPPPPPQPAPPSPAAQTHTAAPVQAAWRSERPLPQAAGPKSQQADAFPAVGGAFPALGCSGGPGKEPMRPRGAWSRSAPVEEPPEKVPTPEDRAKALAAHNAALARAAAKLASKPSVVGSAASCPICATVYVAEKAGPPGQRCVKRLCCGAQLCAACDSKSLKTRQCFFCREESDEFPSLEIACRVSG